VRSSAVDLRPKTWDEIIGNESAVKSLQNLLRKGTVPPAFLFWGDTGLGKSTFAFILAHSVQGDDDSEFIDIRHINAGDKNGIDSARALAEESLYFPTSGKYRVIILDEAHKLTDAAQNALLIPTEDKNSRTIWILCTTEPDKIIPALRGRCQSYELKPFAAKDIETLVNRASNGTGATQAIEEFTNTVVKKGLTNPRDILYAFDRYVSGVPLLEAVVSADTENPVYTEIAKSALSGKWTETAGLLNQVKTADIKGLKSVICWFFRTALLNGNPKSDHIAEVLIRVGNLNAFEDGVSYAALTAILYTYSRKVSQNGTK
jgi:DNA polymerase III subunit gamma/tau